MCFQAPLSTPFATWYRYRIYRKVYNGFTLLDLIVRPQPSYDMATLESHVPGLKKSVISTPFAPNSTAERRRRRRVRANYCGRDMDSTLASPPFLFYLLKCRLRRFSSISHPSVVVVAQKRGERNWFFPFLAAARKCAPAFDIEGAQMKCLVLPDRL